MINPTCIFGTSVEQHCIYIYVAKICNRSTCICVHVGAERFIIGDLKKCQTKRHFGRT